MALQTSGPISLSQVQAEFGGSNPISISEYYGAASGVPGSGTISLSDFYGKSNLFAFNITTNQTNANLRTLAVNAGWDQSAPLVCTINSGVVISGNTAGDSTAAFTINGTFPGGVTLINNGSIRGRGGNGGAARTGSQSGLAGGKGGRALLVSVPATVDNNGTIGAGAGGGGSGGANGGESGAGGGGRSSNINSSPGSSSRTTGEPGAAGVGTISAGGVGGSPIGGSKSVSPAAGGAGGNSIGGVGTKGGDTSVSSGGAGGAGGQAVNGNANITWQSTGTRLGSIV